MSELLPEKTAPATWAQQLEELIADRGRLRLALEEIRRLVSPAPLDPLDEAVLAVIDRVLPLRRAESRCLTRLSTRQPDPDD